MNTYLKIYTSLNIKHNFKLENILKLKQII